MPARSSRKVSAAPRKRKVSVVTKIPVKPLKAIKESKDRTPGLAHFRHIALPYLLGHEKIQLLVEQQGMTPTRVLAIDPGRSNIALCFLDLASNEVISSKIEPPGLKLIGTNILYRELVIERWIQEYQPEVLIVENVAHNYEFGVAEAGRLQYIVERLGIEYGLPVIKIGNPTMRKFIGASGGDNTKSDVKLRVFQRYHREFPSEDECDAFAVAQTGIALLRGAVDVKGKKIARK